MTASASTYANPDSNSFWTAAAEQSLVLQRCCECEHVQFPPRLLCSKCWSASLEDSKSSGLGTIESVTTVRRAPVAAFREKVPYVVAAVRLDEGPRMITNLVSDGALDANIGDKVSVTFTNDERGALPQFRLLA